MISSGKSYGRVARGVLFALVGLLVLGVIGSYWMSLRARSSAVAQTVDQARTIADRSLTLVFDPADLNGPVDATRATELTQQMTSVVLDPSDFGGVTLFSPEGQILYSTAVGRVGDNLVTETDRIREALKDIPQVRSDAGTFSVMLPFRFPSGVGRAVAVELTRPEASIPSAAGAWRTNALFLFGLLVLLGVAVYGVSRFSAAVTMIMAGQPSARPAEPARTTPPAQPTQAARRIELPTPGLREEGEARRRAEERARAAEDRLSVLQDQYRKTLEELQAFQGMSRTPQTRLDPRLEERALRAEGQVHTLQQQIQLLTGERERLARSLDEAERRMDAEAGEGAGVAVQARLREAEQEAIGLRAELEGTHTQLTVTRRELEELRSRGTGDPRPDKDLGASQLELSRTKSELDAARSDASTSRRELDDVRTELRALRNEEQRAAMLNDELRATKAELESASASHRAELVEREAEFEQKVRATREEFQRQLEEIDASYRGQLGQKEAGLAGRIAEAETSARAATREMEAMKAELEGARAEAASREQRAVAVAEELTAQRSAFQALQAELQERTGAAEAAKAETDASREAVDVLQAEVHRAHEAVAQLREELAGERSRAVEAAEVAEDVAGERRAHRERADQLARQLDAATADNAELNRRLQDFEARRQLELADDQGRTEIDDLLRVTQERLAGQTEKLIHTEDRVKELETELATKLDRMEVVEAELRTHQMAEALKEMKHEAVEVGAEPHADAAPIEDRRGATPFTKELSLDAKKTLSRMMGITQILKHKRDAKEQAQLIKQLTSYARRLDHTVSDLGDADRLARGVVELQVKRTDLESLLHRVVDESGIAADHDVRIESETIVIGVDRHRTEQILSGLLRASGDRTPSGKSMAVRLQHRDAGALISVEDPEPSSDVSLSPVVKRFAEMQGGWAKVEGRDGGGSAFRVYLPDGAPPTEGTELKIVVDAEQDVWDSSAEKILVQELHRLAELPGED